MKRVGKIGGAGKRKVACPLFSSQARLIHDAYRRHGYRLAEIADHLGVHYATVSRRLKQAEQDDV